MKTSLPKYLLSPIMLLTTAVLCAQEPVKKDSCDNSPYQLQVDSLKTIFSSKGYTVEREASMNMESEYEMPIAVPMKQGSVYAFVFIGDPSAKLYEVRMYDWNDKQVVYRNKDWVDAEGNIITYTFSPQFTQYHMIKPVQVNKEKKRLCGYVLLFKKVK